MTDEIKYGLKLHNGILGRKIHGSLGRLTISKKGVMYLKSPLPKRRKKTNT